MNKKGWGCPHCQKSFTYSDVADVERLGWTSKREGQWWLRGCCPHCGKMVLITKRGCFRLADAPPDTPPSFTQERPIDLRELRMVQIREPLKLVIRTKER